MKLLAIFLSSFVAFSSASTLDVWLDVCLNQKVHEATTILNGEIEACSIIFFNTGIRESCVDIARYIITKVVDLGVDCVKTLPLENLTQETIDTIVQTIDADIAGYVDAADHFCIDNASSVESALTCFKEEINKYAQMVVDTVKAKAQELGVTVRQ